MEMTEVGRAFYSRLTNREKIVVNTITEGIGNKEIAEHIGTKEQVVKNLIRSILQKSGHGNRLELANYLYANGVVKCPCVAPGEVVLLEKIERMVGALREVDQYLDDLARSVGVTGRLISQRRNIAKILSFSSEGG